MVLIPIRVCIYICALYSPDSLYYIAPGNVCNTKQKALLMEILVQRLAYHKWSKSRTKWIIVYMSTRKLSKAQLRWKKKGTIQRKVLHIVESLTDISCVFSTFLLESGRIVLHCSLWSKVQIGFICILKCNWKVYVIYGGKL